MLVGEEFCVVVGWSGYGGEDGICGGGGGVFSGVCGGGECVVCVFTGVGCCGEVSVVCCDGVVWSLVGDGVGSGELVGVDEGLVCVFSGVAPDWYGVGKRILSKVACGGKVGACLAVVGGMFTGSVAC